jgi:hypothetical protein
MNAGNLWLITEVIFPIRIEFKSYCAKMKQRRKRRWISKGPSWLSRQALQGKVSLPFLLDGDAAHQRKGYDISVNAI